MKNNLNSKKEESFAGAFIFLGVFLFGLLFVSIIDNVIFDIYLPMLQDYHDLLAITLFFPLAYAAYKIILTTKK